MIIENNERRELEIGPSKEKNGAGKGKWKKIAREVGKAQEASIEIQEIIVAMKRTENTDMLVESVGSKRKSVMVRVRTKEKVFRKWWWLLGSTTENNDFLRMESSRTWELPDS